MCRRSSQGFTLIELMVTISLLALMAVLSWRGLDGMVRAHTQATQYAQDAMALQAGLDQWGADLDAMAAQPGSPSLDWDGRALRILRRNTTAPNDGLLVVAWSRRNIDGAGQWLRWQSPPLKMHSEYQLAWQKAALWAQNPGDDERKAEARIVGLQRWQIFYFRGNAWSNPLSAAGETLAGAAPSEPAEPDAIRLILTLAPGQAVSGTLTRDWMRPGIGGRE